MVRRVSSVRLCDHSSSVPCYNLSSRRLLRRPTLQHSSSFHLIQHALSTTNIVRKDIHRGLIADMHPSALCRLKSRFSGVQAEMLDNMIDYLVKPWGRSSRLLCLQFMWALLSLSSATESLLTVAPNGCMPEDRLLLWSISVIIFVAHFGEKSPRLWKVKLLFWEWWMSVKQELKFHIESVSCHFLSGGFSFNTHTVFSSIVSIFIWLWSQIAKAGSIIELVSLSGTC